MVALVTAVGVFALSLALLLLASDAFTSAAEQLGLAMGVSPFIVGATVVAGGTSLPELVSSVLAAASGAPAIVVGSVVGSNVANIFLILGLAAVVGGRLRIDRELMRVDLPLLTASAAFLFVTVWTGPFVWYEGVVALAALLVYVHFSLSEEARLDDVVEDLIAEHVEDADVAVARGDLDAAATEATVGPRTYLVIAASLVAVFLSAEALVRSIVDIAGTLQIGTELVAITAVSLGTSLPEIAVSVAAVRRGSVETAVGNVLGSNVFNSLAVMGIPSFVAPLTVPASIRGYALPVMLVATLLYYFITQDREITAWEGVALLVLYATFLFNLATAV